MLQSREKLLEQQFERQLAQAEAQIKFIQEKYSKVQVLRKDSNSDLTLELQKQI